MEVSIWEQLTKERVLAGIKATKESELGVRRTPLLEIDGRQSELVKSLGLRKLYLKLESLQVGGSFKARGIASFLAAHGHTPGHTPDSSASLRGRRFVTMSAGNFGRTFSLACGRLGCALVVLMPEDVPEERVAAVRGHGAAVELLPRTGLQARVDALVAREGMVYAHPFDDLDLIAGYASLLAELEEDLQAAGEDAVDLLLTGVGGGGLMSGLMAASRLLMRGNGGPLGAVEIVGVEPEGACAMHQSLQQGRPVALQSIHSFVNGLSAPFAGENCFRVASSSCARVLLVTDDSVRAAMRVLTAEFRLLVESSGAAPLAALCALQKEELEGKSVCLVISGGNISIDELSSILSTKGC